MPEIKNQLDVLRILPKTNCRKCDLPTCLTFAVAVIQGNKGLADCPYIDQEVLEQYEVPGSQKPGPEEDSERALEKLGSQIRDIDLSSTVQRLKARFAGDQLLIHCLSKDFAVNPDGTLASDCHLNGWVAGPLLNYVISCQGVDAKGEWVPLRDLPGGADWGRFFEHRCELPFKRLVDNYTNLFEVIIDIFDATPAPDSFDSDIAVIIHPMPRLPVLICYWKPEDGMESSLNMFFDVTAEDNLPIGSIYLLCAGLVTMFEKIAHTHGK